jgi:hypothetical protein
MFVGIGVGIGRNRFAQGIFNAYNARVVADGGITEAGNCVNAVSSLLQSASLLLIPSGYKGGKAYAEIPTNGNGDLTWTRASDAWRTNADGLIQRVPWNLSTYSESFDNLAWSKTNATITANSTTAPNGTLTADTIVSIGADGRALQAFNVLENQNYTFSVWLKSTTSSNVNAAIRSAGNASSIVVTPEWQRFTVTQSYPAAATRFPGISGIANNESVFAWGAQLVEGSSAQTYFPTTDRLNVPRLSYMYGSCPALLLEPQRTNLVLYSKQFDNASWTKLASSVTSNTTTSPDGNTNADTVTSDGTNALHAIQTNSISFNILTNYSLTVFAKKGTNNFVQLVASVAIGGMFANFDLNNGVVGTLGSVTGATPTSSIESVGDGWYRCTMNFTANAISGSVSSICIVNSSSAVRAQQNTLTTSVILWGAQIEVGAYPTTYIPTTTASATRIADSFSRNNIYTNGLITSSGGTWFVELRGNVAYTGGITQAQLLGLGNDAVGATANNFWIACSDATRTRIWKQVAGALTQLYTTTTDTTKIAIKWNGSSADVFANGTKVVSATAFTTTALESLRTVAVQHPYFIQAMALYPSPLSDTDCTTLTTL